MNYEEVIGGVVGLFGPTNVGKSTLLNRLVGQKVAITSHKPQTTRKRIMAVLRRDDMEVVFVDTPGLHEPRHELGEAMMKTCTLAIGEVDIILLILSFEEREPPMMDKILSMIKKADLPIFLAINKMDLVPAESIQETVARLENMGIFSHVLPISALNGTNLDLLISYLRPFLKKGPKLFGEDMISDQSMEESVGEIIREKVYQFLRAELPYSTAITVEEIKEVPQKQMLVIHAKIHVETQSQKKIVIGEGGKMIKRIGEAARKELEFLLKKRVYLDLFLRVEKNWTRDPKALRKLGFL
ncbi:MAG: GTPase Era [Desulfatiglandales bacterium]